MTDLSRERAVALDEADPIASLRDAFVNDDPELIYLDGNSLGRLPKATPDRIARLVRDEWGNGLIRSWRHWVDLPFAVGDLIGSSLLGAGDGQVVVADSTTVNLYKLAAAALDARPGRTVIVADDDNFPTDRYALEGLAAQRGLELRLVHSDIDAGLKQTMTVADDLQINGTPTFVLGDSVVVGAVGYDELKSKIDAVHKCGHATC